MLNVMERVRLSADLAKAVQGVQQAANPLQKVSAAKVVADLLKRLGASDSGRAPSGGVIGMNGEFYKGGTFLPRTTLPKQGSSSVSAGAGRQLIEPGVYDTKPSDEAKSIFGAYREFIDFKDGKAFVVDRPDAAINAFVDSDVQKGREFLSAAVSAYNDGMRWFVDGEISPVQSNELAGEKDQVPAHDLIEYTTKKGKVLRGIIRADLSYAEAKAIDEYTFKYQGGWFIREKHLGGAELPPMAAPVDPAESAAKAAESLADREAKKLQERVGKLRDISAAAIEKAESVINQDRNTNTSRRAGMAANITQRAEKDRALAITMGNIADAMELGELQYLKELSSKAQLESMQKVLLNAMYQTDKNLSYSEQQKIQGRAPDQRDIDNAVIPVIRMDANWSSLVNDLERKAPRGYKKFLDKYRYVDKSNMSIAQAEEVLAMIKANGSYTVDLAERISHRKRIAALGISTNKELGDALAEFIRFRSGARKEDPLKKAERELIGQKVGFDFFPTPASVANRMALLAGITEGERVLEPSAGNGNLADAAKAAGGVVDVIEISPALQNILKLKGYNLVDTDFDSFDGEGQYDAILMNPPWGNRMDAAHIMRAYDFLKAGGRLVAIAGEGVFFGSDQKAKAFRDWLDSKGAEVEQLEKNTFMEKNLLATTGAAGRLIVIEK